jgi:type IV secretory pathway VirB10-like protein
MTKYLIMAVSLMTTIFMMSILAPGSSRHAQADDSIWMDEGDGDFDYVDAGAEAPPVAEPAPQAPPVAKPAPVPAPPVAVETEEEVSAPAPKRKAAAPAAASARSKASVAGKGRFMTTRESCPLLREPASDRQLTVVKGERKIWIEEVDESWVRAYNKAGEPGYISRDCFN